MKMKQKMSFILISIIFLSATALAAPANNTTNNTTKPIVITKLTANFTAYHSMKMPLKVMFTDKSTGNPDKWYWDFGDKTVSKAKNPVHTYKKAGKYTVTLKIMDAKGATSTVKKTINLTMKGK